MSEIIYGIHATHALLEHDPKRFLDVYLLKKHNNDRLHILVTHFKKFGITIQLVSRQWLDKKSNNATHQGIIARVHSLHKHQESELPILITQQTVPLLLILDGITDPHNLGACMRCADAAGVHVVIAPRHNVAPLNAVAKKVASGAAETVPFIRITNLARTLHLLQKYKLRIVGATNKADHDLYHSQLTGPLALVVGAEDKGIRRLTQKHCNELIHIPMFGTVTSLNLSVAVGICLFEIIRQRGL